MEVDTDYSAVQGSQDREVELINQKILQKNEIQSIQKKKLIYTECGNNVITVSEDSVSSEIVGGTF